MANELPTVSAHTTLNTDMALHQLSGALRESSLGPPFESWNVMLYDIMDRTVTDL